MSTSRDSCCLPSVKKQKHDFQVFAFVQCIIKQLLDSVFVISRIIKVSVRVISLSLRLRLITLTSTLIILDITKTSSNNCLQYNGPKPELYRRYIDDCIGVTSSTREELNPFITAVNSFHPALKYTWEIYNTSFAFLDIKVSVEGNGLCTSVHYKPTDSRSYLL